MDNSKPASRLRLKHLNARDRRPDEWFVYVTWLVFVVQRRAVDKATASVGVSVSQITLQRDLRYQPSPLPAPPTPIRRCPEQYRWLFEIYGHLIMRFVRDFWRRLVCRRQSISPSYLSSMCQSVSVNPSRRCLRSAARGDLVVLATKTVCYGPRGFAVAGTWNSLPTSIRDNQLSVPAFRRLLKTELFTRAYDSS